MSVYLLLLVILGPPKFVGPRDMTINTAVYANAEKCLEAQAKESVNDNVIQASCLKKEVRK